MSNEVIEKLMAKVVYLVVSSEDDIDEEISHPIIGSNSSSEYLDVDDIAKDKFIYNLLYKKPNITTIEKPKLLLDKVQDFIKKTQNNNENIVKNIQGVCDIEIDNICSEISQPQPKIEIIENGIPPLDILSQQETPSKTFKYPTRYSERVRKREKPELGQDSVILNNKKPKINKKSTTNNNISTNTTSSTTVNITPTKRKRAKSTYLLFDRSNISQII